MGSSLWNLLLSEGVDLILNGHEHTYQRTKQLELDPVACPSMTPGTYVAGCIVDDGTDGVYPKGTGSTNVVVGNFGQSLYRVDPNDSEAPYFSRIDDTTWGYIELSVAADRIDAHFQNTTGTFIDAFSIVAGARRRRPRAADHARCLSATATSDDGGPHASPSSDAPGSTTTRSTDGAALGSHRARPTDTTATPGAMRYTGPTTRRNPSASAPAATMHGRPGADVLTAADATPVQTYPNATRGTYTNLAHPVP
jgi:hypothetical protein